MNNLTWALPSGYDWDIKKFAKQVTTKAWTKKHKAKLSVYADMLTSEGCDTKVIVKRMLTSGFGVNIGEQVFNHLDKKLNEEQFNSIKWNIIKSQYN